MIRVNSKGERFFSLAHAIFSGSTMNLMDTGHKNNSYFLEKSFKNLLIKCIADS